MKKICQHLSATVTQSFDDSLTVRHVIAKAGKLYDFTSLCKIEIAHDAIFRQMIKLSCWASKKYLVVVKILVHWFKLPKE